MSKIYIMALLTLLISPSYAYVDTTPSNFKKPKPIQVQPYVYKESKVNKYTEKAVEQVAPLMMGGIVTGPMRIIELGNRALNLQEKNNTKSQNPYY